MGLSKLTGIGSEPKSGKPYLKLVSVVGLKVTWFMTSLQFRGTVLFSLILLAGCSDSVQQLARTQTAAHPESTILAMLNGGIERSPLNLTSHCALDEFYAARKYYPVWIKNAKLTSLADSLLDVIHHSDYFGLIPQEYHVSQIDSLVLAFQSSPDDLALTAELDILMTDALFTIGYHIHYGRVQPSGASWVPRYTDADKKLIHVLEQSIHKNSIRRGLAVLEPAHAPYKILRRELQRKLDALFLAEDDSVKNLLNAQISELMINMEQWRLESKSFSGRYILVNIPSFKLEVKEHDTLVFESAVVVGTPQTPTPTLDSNIKSAVLFPYWNVPRDIATLELLPKIKRDSLYLQAHRYRVIDMTGNVLNPDSIDWKQYHVNNFPFMLQQEEGESNALGIIKFPFISDRPIYLHDTNAKRFFKRDLRAYSHGCVRVERALELAKYLAGETRVATDIDTYIQARQQQYVSLNPIDVYIRYYTCEAKQDGSVAFHQDVYDWNKGLRDAIYCRVN